MRFYQLIVVGALIAGAGGAQAPPQLVISAGHAGAPDRAVFVGPYLATASWSNVALVDPATGLTVARLPQRSLVEGLDANPDGTLLAVGTCGHAIHLWDVRSRTIVRTLTLKQECAESVSFSPDGSLLVTDGYQCGCRAASGIQVWDVRSGTLVRELVSDAGNRSVVFGGNGTWIGAVDDKERATIFEWPSGRERRAFSVSPDIGRFSAITSRDGRYFGWTGSSLHVWDAVTGTEMSLPRNASASVSAARFLDDGRFAFVDGSELTTLRLPGGAPSARTLPQPRANSDVVFGYSWLAIDRDGSRVAGADQPGLGSEIVMWDARSDRKAELQSPALADARHLQWSRGELVGWTGVGTGARGWNTRTGAPATGLRDEDADTLTFSPDGTRIAVADGSRVRVLELAGGRTAATRQIDNVGDTVVALAPAGRRAAFVSAKALSLFDDGLRVTRPLEFLGEHMSVERLAFSPDGRWLAAGLSRAGSDLRVYRVDGSAAAVTLDSEDVYREHPPAFSSDSRWLASFVRGTTLTIWSTESWKIARSWTLSASGESLAFAPEGRRIAAAGGTDAGIWDAETGRRLVALATPDGAALREIAWSPDGQRVVTAGDDGVLRFWSAANGRLLASLYMLDAGEDWLLVSADGRIDGTDTAVSKLVAWRIGDRVATNADLTRQARTRGLWRSLR